MPVSYKNKIYTTLGTPTALSGDIVSVTNSSGVPAKDYTIKGKAIVWNQLFTNSVISSNGVTISNNQDRTITLNGTANKSYIDFTPLSDAMNQVHKYLLCLKILNNPDNISFFYGWPNRSGMRTGIISTGESCVVCNQTTSLTQLGRGNGLSGFAVGTVFNNVKIAVMVMDLTQMFGAGNEPSTPEEFRAMFPADYYPYNVGELKTIVPTSIEASGINLLNLVGRKEISSVTVGYRIPTDAYPEIDAHIYYRGISANGYLSPSTVTEATVLSSSVIAKTGTAGGSDGYGVGIPLTVVPSTTYYIKCTTSGAVGVGYANSNKIITSYNWTLSNNQFTTPRDCRYALIVFRPNAYDTLATFENICVSTVQTNEYQPYNKYRVNIPSSKYFPDGMRSAGSAYDEMQNDEAIKRIGVVDLGTLNWTYTSTPSHERFDAVVSGIKLVSEVSIRGNLVCSKYTTDSASNVYSHVADKAIAVHNKVERVWVYDTSYTDAATFKAAMSGVMLYYELDTPISTAISPPLQALPTYRGFNSFSALNSLTQNGPLSVTYYAEGGASPESGWLTSYKRKLYMGRTIEWNQLIDKSKSYFTGTYVNGGVTWINNGDGTYSVTGSPTTSTTAIVQKFTADMPAGHVYYLCGLPTALSVTQDIIMGVYKNGVGVFTAYNQIKTARAAFNEVRIVVIGGRSVSNVLVKPQLFDLTQMFGAGNEPSTPEEFWSYFDRKLYPYNAGETQPLFKISRKSQWGGGS